MSVGDGVEDDLVFMSPAPLPDFEYDEPEKSVLETMVSLVEESSKRLELSMEETARGSEERILDYIDSVERRLKKSIDVAVERLTIAFDTRSTAVSPPKSKLSSSKTAIVVKEKSNIAAGSDDMQGWQQSSSLTDLELIVKQVTVDAQKKQTLPHIITHVTFNCLRQSSRRKRDDWDERIIQNMWIPLTSFASTKVIHAADIHMTTLKSLRLGPRRIWYMFRSTISAVDGTKGIGFCHWYKIFISLALDGGIVAMSVFNKVYSSYEANGIDGRIDMAAYLAQLNCEPLIAAHQSFHILFSAHGFARHNLEGFAIDPDSEWMGLNSAIETVKKNWRKKSRSWEDESSDES